MLSKGLLLFVSCLPSRTDPTGFIKSDRFHKFNAGFVRYIECKLRILSKAQTLQFARDVDSYMKIIFVFSL